MNGKDETRIEKKSLIKTEQGEFDSETYFRALKSAKGQAKVTEAITAILTAKGFDPNRRGIVMALHGRAGGSFDWVQISMIELGKLLYTVDDSLSGDELETRLRSIKDQASRALKQFIAEQEKLGCTLIEYQEGEQKRTLERTVNIPSKFRLSTMYKLVAATIEEFPAQARQAKSERKVNSETLDLPKQASVKTLMQRSALEVFKRNEIPTDLPARKTNRKPPDYLKSYRAQVFTFAQKTAEEAEKLGKPKYETLQELAEELASVAAGVRCDSRVPPSIESQGGTHPEQGTATEGDLALEAERIGAKQPPCDSSATMSEAREALNAFLSVDAYPDQVLFKDDDANPPKVVRQNHITTAQFSAEVEGMIHDARQNSESFIARIRGPVLQVDDCNTDTFHLLKSFCFAAFETSQGNYQCWLAFADDEDKQAARDQFFHGLREILPTTNANSGSGGAIRWPGSINYKPNRRSADGNFWCVRIVHVDKGRLVTPSELDDAGVLAMPHAADVSAATLSLPPESERVGWPAYDLATAPLKSDKSGPDASRADARFVTAAFWCFGKRDRAAIERKLREVSSHAREEEPESYARRTVDRVGDWLRARRGIDC